MIHKRIPYRRMQERKAKKRYKHNHDNSYCDALGYYYHNDHWVNSGRGRMSKRHKRLSNKRIRQMNKECYSRGMYKKVYDYWWEVI